jgi:predicted RNA binding protein YcfA (HicA-like mRNA interferase family)
LGKSAFVAASHFVYRLPGRPRIVVPVHGNRDLKPKIQRDIMRDAGLTDADL